MRGLPLNGNLLAVGARFVRETKTAPVYRLWSINDVHPAMLRVTS
ncbi:MAG: glutamyl-tRNA amidotransferase, partial [Candidatus Rokuibacteriota bacterium]